MNTAFSIHPLVGLGLTPLESKIYAYLSENSPATGYRVAKAIGTPTANTYKAIQSLQDKGAVIIEDGTNRLCRAVATEEFLDRLERRFSDLKTQARKELAKLKPAPEDERFYYLQTSDQVFERFRTMLAKCERVALLDLFPLTLDEIRRDIESAASRGIRVAVKVYQPCEVPGAQVVIAPKGEGTIRRWPGQWANGVVDGREHVLAFFSRDGARVLQAVWSTNAYTSWVYHSGLMFELLHGALLEGFRGLKAKGPLPERYKRLDVIKGADLPGYRTLLERFSEEENEL